MSGHAEFQQRLESIEDLIRRVEEGTDPHARSTTQELVQLVMDLHAAGLEKILDILHAAGEPGQALVGSLGRDALVSNLLALHNLHPLSLDDRVKLAVEKVDRQIRSRGGEVELLSIDNGEVRLQLHANGHAQALKEVVEGAVYQAAPDITALIVEGAEDRAGFVPLEMLRSAPPVPHNGHAVVAGEKGGL